MFYYTYLLSCKNSRTNKTSFYIGITSNLIQRIKDHKSRSTKTTKKFDIIELVYYEASRSKIDARKRELQLKTGFGRGYLKRRLENDLKTRDHS